MKTKHNMSCFLRQYDLDLAVIGGGVAGVVAAIAAAREGLTTGLMNNRPVLGGPSGNECNRRSHGQGVNGASSYTNRNARETGILEELKLEALARLDQGWSCHWSLLLREYVQREKNIVFWPNTEACEVEMDGSRIASVTGRCVGSETTVVFRAPMFTDATGDGTAGYAAGADYRMGREGRDEFDESLAPALPDAKTMGQTITFQSRDVGHPVPFIPPDWAMTFETDDDLPFRIHRRVSEGFWWIEYGGEIDTIADNEDIYQTLLSVLFGVWDHIKNRGDHGAENLVIDWFSPFPGKRESRRFLGDYILTQHDVVNTARFDDGVAYGGWPIDLHPPEGVFGKSHPGSTPPFVFPEIYQIPFRCLYSRNVENLMLAGRDISVTHVALGTTRLMATCGLCGQAVGTAAAIMKERHLNSPRQLLDGHVPALRARLFRKDVSLPGETYRDPDNLALLARASASSSMGLHLDGQAGLLPLVPAPIVSDDPAVVSPYKDRRRAQMFPVSTDRIETLAVKVQNDQSQPVELSASLHPARAANDFTPTAELASARATLAPNGTQWVEFHFAADVEPGKLYWVQLEPVENVSLCLCDVPLPGLYLKPDSCYFTDDNWSLSITPEQAVFGPANAIDGFSRAGDWPHLWISDSTEPLPQSLELDFGQEVGFDRVDLVFDTNLNKLVDHGPVPQCVRDCDLQIARGERWETLYRLRNNHHRFVRVDMPRTSARRFRVSVLATNGASSARIYEVRIWKKTHETEHTE